MSDLQDSLNALKDPAPSQEVQEAPEVGEPEYQQYASTRLSICLIVPGGKRINFTNYEYYTKDPEIMEYLDTQIAKGLRGYAKGKRVRAEDINPMAALKRKHIEEFMASQEGRDFTSRLADPEKIAQKAAMLSTSGVAAAGE